MYAAQERLKPYLLPSPLLYSSLLHQKLNINVWLKLETQLPTGSFKPRPALNSILSQLEAAKKRGIIASSSGNFAQGVAYAAKKLGINALIVMTKSTSPYKIQRTKELGAEVVLCADSHQERIETTQRLQRETNRLQLEPYDSDETIAGDGTIGLELSAQLGEKLNQDFTVLVPVSGGGLLAGIAFTLKTLHPTCKIIGIQPQNNNSLSQSFAAKKRINVGHVKTIADALGASTPGEKPFKIIMDYVDDVINVTEDEIQNATQLLIEQHKLVVEPGGATPVAALLANKVYGNQIVCITSGGNIQLTSSLLL